jgi:hypothetical protein
MLCCGPAFSTTSPNKKKDPRTDHQALPAVTNGVKYGANAWVHQRDFKNSKLGYVLLLVSKPFIIDYLLVFKLLRLVHFYL